MKSIQFYAEGIPKGQPRPKAFSRGGHASCYDPGTAEGWKSRIADAARPFKPESPLTGPLTLTLRFFFPRPKSHYRTGKRSSELKELVPYHQIVKPDLDNLAKAVMDAMTQLGFWIDDAQVAELAVSKMYATQQSPGCNISLIQHTSTHITP